MEFFDCNTWIGAPVSGRLFKPETAKSLIAAMDKAGIARAVVWHISQLDAGPVTGNALLSKAVAAHERLYGSWTILPTQTGEMDEPDEWLNRAYDARVRLLRAFPAANRYLLRAVAIGDILSVAARRKFPLMISLTRDTNNGPGSKQWENIYALLSEFPDLTLILSDLHVWPDDRHFRPLIEKYPRTFIEISRYIADGGIESFVARYGAGRMLFGSGFPDCYHGSSMLYLAHAEISAAERASIASGNLTRLLSEVRR